MNTSKNNQIRSKIIIAIFGVILVCFAWIYCGRECEKQEQFLNQRIKNPTNGIVEIKNLNAEKFPQIKLKNKKAYIENKEIWDAIKLGDSLHTNQDSAILEIYRQKKIFKINLKKVYGCDHNSRRIIHKKWINI